MAAGKHNAAAVVHGLRTWRLLLLPSIIGERAPALSTLVLYQLLFSAFVGLRPLLTCALRKSRGQRTVLTRPQRTDGRVGIGTAVAV